jgi:HEAT repeat protein
MPKEIPFKSVLDALCDNTTAFPARYLPRFSDLGPADLKDLMAVWEHVPALRKGQLMKSLADRLEEDTLVSFEALARALMNDADPGVRLYAIRILWESRDPQLAPELIRIMREDPVEDVRAEAATVLGSFIFAGEVEETPAGVLKKVEDALFSEMKQVGQGLVKRRALESLGYSSRPEVPALITAAFNQRDPAWIASALFAMGRSADQERWEEEVLYAIDHDNLEVRLAAVEAAGELNFLAARDALITLLEDETDDAIYRAAIWSLSQIGDEDVRLYLQNLLDKVEDEEAAVYIEEALDNLTFTEDIEKFDLLAYDPDVDDEEE